MRAVKCRVGGEKNFARRECVFDKCDPPRFMEGRGGGVGRKPRNVGGSRPAKREEAPVVVYLGESPCRMWMTLTTGAVGISVG